MRDTIFHISKGFECAFRMRNAIRLYLGLCSYLAVTLNAQMPLIDRGIYTSGLWCFPLHGDTLTYVYLPNKATFAIDDRGRPQFSYLRYVINKPSGNTSSNVITEADGGGILHLVAKYETDQESLSEALAFLRKIHKNNPNVKIRGPVNVEKGRFALVSSILKEGHTKRDTQVISMGDAPVFENTGLALSFGLNPSASKLLLESFKMASPDVSIVFDLAFSGLSESYDAELVVNWAEVKKSQAFKAGGSIYFIGADVDLAFEQLRRDNAIKLTMNGSNETMEHLLNVVYDKLLNLLFKPAEPEKVDQQGGLSSAMSALMQNFNSRQTVGFGLNVGLQLKEMQNSGTSRLQFKGRSTLSRHHFIVFNVGDIYQKKGTDPNYFKDVPMWDSTFQTREVFIGVDGDLEKEFTKMLNSITVNVRKKHASGVVFSDSKVINAESFISGFKPLTVAYGWDADSNRIEWMNYEYQSVFNFQGGKQFTTDWEQSNSGMVSAYTPFSRKVLRFDGDMKKLKSIGVRMISIEVKFPFFGETRKSRITLQPDDLISEKAIEITLPNDREEVDYEITWQKTDGSSYCAKGRDRYGLIFIDELPENICK